MSEVDQRSGAIRLRRLLTRALTIVGTTVAGTSIAWAVGTGVAVAAEDGPAASADAGPVRVGSEQHTVPPEAGTDSAWSHVDGPVRDTGRSLLESVARATAPGKAADREVPPKSTPDADAERASHPTEPSIAELPAGVVHRVTGAVGTLAHRADAALEPVGRLGDAVLPGHGDRGVIDVVDPVEIPFDHVEVPIGGVDAPGSDLPRSPGTAPDHRDQRGSLERPAPRIPHAPVVPSPHQSSGAVPDTATAQTASPVAVDGSVDERSPAQRPASGPALPPAVPAPVSYPCGSDGYLATGHGAHSGAGLIGHPTDHTRLGRTHVRPARTVARPLAGESRPQPGVTPD